MCLLVFAVNAHPRFRLILAGNRDEFHARDTAAAGWWSGNPSLLGGRDQQGGGTWLGVGTTGRFAAITNIRDRIPAPVNAPTRGQLVSEFVRAKVSAIDYLDHLRPRAQAFAGFNLVVGDEKAVNFFSSRSQRRVTLERGIHGLSNDGLDTPWPKVIRAKEGISRLLMQNEPDEEGIFEIFSDRSIAPDDELPDTGVGLELERMLSACFIVNPHYGTRSTTLVFISNDGYVRFSERQFDATGKMNGQQTFEFDVVEEEAGRTA